MRKPDYESVGTISSTKYWNFGKAITVYLTNQVSDEAGTTAYPNICLEVYDRDFPDKWLTVEEALEMQNLMGQAIEFAKQLKEELNAGRISL